MSVISDILNKYRSKLDYLDLELIIAHAIKKPREFVLTHTEYELVKSEKLKVKSYLSRRIKHEPLAYILGEKEFYKLKFKVNKNTLIPRPETEMMIDLILHNIKHGTWNKKNKLRIVDIGTGSGNIIVALAKSLLNHESRIMNYAFYGIDISAKALTVAKQNAKLNKIDKKIKFLNGNLLEPIRKELSLAIGHQSLAIATNLPYLSPRIYKSCLKDIKKYEPKSALSSQKEGLHHYDNLLSQITKLEKNCSMLHVLCFMEISPEQKLKITKLIKNYFPSAKIFFHKDLSGRWRICEAEFRI